MAEDMVDERQFRRSDQLSVGTELELQLVRARDFDLARDAADLIERLEKRALSGAVKPEITEGMIELNSSVQAHYPALLEELSAMRDVVVEDAGILNLYVSGGGSHPFHDWTERRITPSERFSALFERYGYLAKQFTVFGQHAHVDAAAAIVQRDEGLAPAKAVAHAYIDHQPANPGVLFLAAEALCCAPAVEFFQPLP